MVVILTSEIFLRLFHRFYLKWHFVVGNLISVTHITLSRKTKMIPRICRLNCLIIQNSKSKDFCFEKSFHYIKGNFLSDIGSFMKKRKSVLTIKVIYSSGLYLFYSVYNQLFVYISDYNSLAYDWIKSKKRTFSSYIDKKNFFLLPLQFEFIYKTEHIKRAYKPLCISADFLLVHSFSRVDIKIWKHNKRTWTTKSDPLSEFDFSVRNTISWISHGT
jgi:hypothetical protein